MRDHALPKSVLPKEHIRYSELVLDKHDSLTEIHRVPGENDTGMIAWRITLFVPECPEGRDIIVIANDITYKTGTFGPKEDKLFMRASELSRAHKIPRIYISGAWKPLMVDNLVRVKRVGMWRILNFLILSWNDIELS